MAIASLFSARLATPALAGLKRAKMEGVLTLVVAKTVDSTHDVTLTPELASARKVSWETLIISVCRPLDLPCVVPVAELIRIAHTVHPTSANVIAGTAVILTWVALQVRVNWSTLAPP